MRKNKLQIGFVLLILTIINCQSQNKTNTKMFEWYPTSAAPRNYPISLFIGALIDSDSLITGLPDQYYLNNGWAISGLIQQVGDLEKKIPVNLYLKWFSFRERKAYKYDGEFPYDLVNEAFNKGFVSPVDDSLRTYKYIIFNFSPLGGISIILAGYGVQKEIAFLKAEECILNSEEILELTGGEPELEKYSIKRLDEEFKGQDLLKVDSNTVGIKNWSDSYRIKYKCELNIISPLTIDFLMMKFFNGEDLYWRKYTDFNSIEMHPIMKEISIGLRSTNGEKYTTSILFDEAEIFKAFRALNVNDEKIIIQPEIKASTNSVEVFLKNSKNVIQLQKCNFKKR